MPGQILNFQRQFTGGPLTIQVAPSKPEKNVIQLKGNLPPQSASLYEEFQRGTSFADAPALLLTEHPNVRSWHEISGGVGRLSDQISSMRKWLRDTSPHLAIVSQTLVVSVGPKMRCIRSYCLAQLVPIGQLKQLPLFNEEEAA